MDKTQVKTEREPILPQSYNDEIWKLEKGWIAAYTENKTTMKSIRRYKPHWKVIAEYHYKNNGQLKALQYKIPISERRQAERMFNTKL